ncbi:hypothetical protein KRR38_23120 [Novosphingobium sp. G106]|uniref:hypothetical protein n=1 Tax=Novosphingobium sp. G106 TaxID=2849500 RepID=UPI001C2DDD3A|nr:hypothetical protein [Novosphingobium sp. G106]MBV1690492.1 hypothetical protein [Novosphingobium sp. G106]
MSPRFLALSVALALCGCKQPIPPTRSLVGDAAAPGIYALAGDTITVWQRVRLADGMWRFHSWSITPGGTVEYLDTPERADEPTEESAADLAERRQSFALPQSEFEALRKQAALLRPMALGPDDPVRGYAGEAYPRGCMPDKAKPSLAGINFLNKSNWGSFLLPTNCASREGTEASGLMTEIVSRLNAASAQIRAK